MKPGHFFDGRPMWYVLDGHTPVPAESMDDVETLMEDSKARRVARTQIDSNCWVSTVFLCLDHSYHKSQGPILFETMTFRNGKDEEQWRYHTWDEAVAGHEHAVALALGKPLQ